MSRTVCLAPASTIDYPQGGGHLWVYLQWALALRAAGCRVIWMEGVDTGAGAGPRRPRRHAIDARTQVATLKRRLAPYHLEDAIALVPLGDAPVPRDLTEGCLDLDAAAEADLLLNLWHSLPAPIVERFRRSAFVDTDPGLLQIWMTTGDIRVAPHDAYFTIGETVGTPGANFPDCGLRWLHAMPPVFLPEWPLTPVNRAAPYTTVAHWWGGTFDFNGITFCNEKRVSFLEYLELPARTSVPIELAVCLAEHFEEYDRLMGPKGWRLREAWEVSGTPEQYRAYVQQSRGEFSCAKPAYVTLQTAWVSDRTLCYLASGKPAVVQHTGASRFLPDADGLFRFRNPDEAVQALAAVERDYERHGRLARAFVEEHCDAQRVVTGVLERALDGGVPARSLDRSVLARPLDDRSSSRATGRRNDAWSALGEIGEAGVAELSDLLSATLEGARLEAVYRLKRRVYRLEIVDGAHRSVVLKRLDPAVANRNELLVTRWLPALGLPDRCARLLGVAAERSGRCVWHVYEDLGDETLAARPSAERIAATVDLVAELHARGAGHAVLPDARHQGGSRGISYFIDNLRDAVAALKLLADSGVEPPTGHAGIVERLIQRARALLADVPRRTRIFERAGAPDTLLHGDLWPINVFVPDTGEGPRARLVDWDQVAVGPFSYDLSTLLLRLPAGDRCEIVERYCAAMDPHGWEKVSRDDLDVMMDTAERARCANGIIWPTLAVVREGADWGFPQLAEVERWFEALDHRSGSEAAGYRFSGQRVELTSHRVE